MKETLRAIVMFLFVLPTLLIVGTILGSAVAPVIGTIIGFVSGIVIFCKWLDDGFGSLFFDD